MQYAVISDVHSNLEALEAVLKDMKARGFSAGGKKAPLFLGDAVGYGPNPNECIKLLKESAGVMLAGNHDRALLGLTDIEHFNPYAKAAIEWTSSVVSEENKTALRSLPIAMSLKQDGLFLVHSTPQNPEEWHYLLTAWDAEINLNYFSERICLLGHSHMPFILEKTHSGQIQTHKDEARLLKTARYIINVGSVGQPRDHDPRACYAVIDDNHAEIIRVEYEIKKTQHKMLNLALPEPLIARLSKGV